jgi:fructosamine-3-kinase
LKFGHRQPVSGGCIHRCYRVPEGFLKVNDAGHVDVFAAEADGLAALRAAGCAVPKPVEHGVDGGDGYLLLEWLDLGAAGDFASLGRMLARLHGSTGERFGWARDNYIGATRQSNRRADDWKTFWLEQRMAPQLELARRNGHRVDPLLDRACDLLDGHAPQPSLVHGDLWSGNVGFTADGPLMFDPAVYYGDREVDLAMTELFGGFPPAFYSAYGPLPAGYETRKHLYNLYHLLNHLNLFGGGYLAQVKATLGLLRRAL